MNLEPRLEILELKMNSQFIVFVQVFIVIIFVIWIISRRGETPKPTVLNMSTSNTTDKKIEPQKPKTPPDPENIASIYAQSAANYKPRKYDAKYFTDDKIVHAKVLNVIFMWNGHSWDAYEVFGLPAGSSVESVRAKYNELRSLSDSGQQEFLLEALRAIENKVSSA